jgi:hypothetical protein
VYSMLSVQVAQINEGANLYLYILRADKQQKCQNAKD